MHLNKQLTLVSAALACSMAVFGQTTPNHYVLPAPQAVTTQVESYEIGYMANLNIGDSVLNITNDGAQGGFGLTGGTPAGNTEGNICVNVYAFDAAEEEISCCSCLVTPNGLNSLSATADITSNPLTPAIPTSLVIKLIASQPALSVPVGAAGATGAGTFTVCNPSSLDPTGPGNGIPYTVPGTGLTLPAGGAPLASGLHAWITTLEPTMPVGTYGAVGFKLDYGQLSVLELGQLVGVCAFIQGDASGFGICKSCRTGALGGSKK